MQGKPKIVEALLNLRYWRPSDIDALMQQEGPKYFFWTLFSIGLVVVFLERCLFYLVIDRTVFDILGFGVVVARASASGIKFSCAVILLPVMRNFMCWLRGTFLGSWLPIDKAHLVHIRIAAVVLVLTMMHIIGHCFNQHAIAYRATKEQLDALNLARPENTYVLMFLTLPGATGNIVFCSMVLMYSTAFERVRRITYDLFWMTHHLFIVFFVGLMVHGAAAILEPPTFWVWTIIPLTGYLIERMVRFLRGVQDTVLLLAIAHPADVLELQMKKAHFRYKAGQYLFLNCPYLDRFAYHAFTITSAPDDEYVSVHMKKAGDFTAAVHRLINPDRQLGVVRENMLTAPTGVPIFRIDGPFGTPSQQYKSFKVLVLIGSGVGIAPFIAILRQLRYDLERKKAKGKRGRQRKVYFFFITREKNSLEWLFELLHFLEETDEDELFEFNLFVTGLNLKQAGEKGLLEPDSLGRDQITGLRTPTQFGRPDFAKKFREIAREWDGYTVGVLFCGAPVLKKQLYRICVELSRNKARREIFGDAIDEDIDVEAGEGKKKKEEQKKKKEKGTNFIFASEVF